MLKRIFDLALVIPLILIFLPVIAISAVLVRIKLGSPVFFIQERPGLNGQPFNMVKFRTMVNAVDSYGNTLSDAERLTTFGKKLRSTSLDELPEFWNVLKGEMSLVGPRPLLMQYLPLYSQEQFRRHEVRPGLTGLAQVSGRNNLTWPEKFRLDIEYVNGQSLLLDIRILCLTAIAVIKRTGISSESDATMSPFRGEH